MDSPEYRRVLDKLVLGMVSAIARERVDFGGQFARVTVDEVDLSAIRAALAALDSVEDRIRSERDATWSHAAKLVDYETGRDLDILEDAFNEDTARPLRETRRDGAMSETTEATTNGPWKWLSYPSGAKLLAGRERAVIHCPDAPMSVNKADQALIASAPEMRKELDHIAQILGADITRQNTNPLPEPREPLGPLALAVYGMVQELREHRRAVPR